MLIAIISKNCLCLPFKLLSLFTCAQVWQFYVIGFCETHIHYEGQMVKEEI